MEWLDLALDLVFPEPCPSCGGEPARTVPMPLCSACVGQLWPLPRVVQLEKGPRLVVALGRYEGPLGRTLLQAKRGSRTRVLTGLGRWTTERLVGRVPEVDAVVAVPSSMRRGVDTAHLLAKPLAAQLGVPLLPLIRRVSREGQRGRDALERRVHASTAYRVPVPAHGDLPDRVLLIDDVCTTGATLQACTDELLGAGVRRVYGAALTVAGADYLEGVEAALGDDDAPQASWLP